MPLKEGTLSKFNHLVEGDSLLIELDPVPKLLGMIKVWCPLAKVISFKLETDETLLEGKAQAAINKYGVDLVIANLLQTRMTAVSIISKDSKFDLVTQGGQELEELIVNWLLSNFIKN